MINQTNKTNKSNRTNKTNKKLNSTLELFWSPYALFALILIISSPLFFLRGIGVFDDSVYLKIGELINQGLHPYKDVFDNKPPGIYYLAALIAWIGRNHWLTNRLFLFIFAAILGFSVIKYTRYIWTNQAAYFAAFIFGTSYIITQGYSFHTEQFCTALGFAAICIVSQKRSHQLINWIISGCLVGIAFLFKQVAILYLIAFICCELFLALTKVKNSTTAIRRCVFLLLGFCLSIAIPFALLVFSGLWSNFYQDVFLGVVPFAENKISITDTLKLWLKVPATLLVLIIPVILIFSKIRTAILKSEVFPEIALLLLTGCLSLLPTFKLNSNTHYSGTAILTLSIAEAIIISQLWHSKFKYPSKLFKNLEKKVVVALSLLLAVYILALSWGSIVMVKGNRIASDLKQMSEMRNILNQHINPSQPVLALSEHAAARIYYMSGHLPFTKYIYYYWNTDIDIYQAASLLFTSDVPAAILELPTQGQADWFPKEKFDVLKDKYLKIELSSQSASHLAGKEITILISRKNHN